MKYLGSNTLVVPIISIAFKTLERGKTDCSLYSEKMRRFIVESKLKGERLGANELSYEFIDDKPNLLQTHIFKFYLISEREK